MVLRAALGAMAAAVSMAAYVPYLRATIRGTTQPSVASWGLWSLLGALLCVSYRSVGAAATLGVPLSNVVGPLLIVVVAAPRAVRRGLDRLEAVCLALALLVLLRWALHRDAAHALRLFLLIDLLSALPTLRNAYRNPASEDRLAWALFLVANTLNLAALESVRFDLAAYPLYLFALTLLLNALLLPRRPFRAPA